MLTNDSAMATMAYSLSNCGRQKDGAWYAHYLLGGNYRLGEFQGALLRVQLQRYPAHLQLRQANATYLAQLLASVEGVTPLPDDQRVTANAYHIMFLRYQAAAFGGMPRATFIAALQAEGITGVHGGYSLPAYRQPVMQTKNFGLATPPLFSGVHPQPPDYRTISHPVTERACAEEAIWIRHNMLLGERRDMEDIVEAIRKIQRYHDELRW